jgi:hypothetical protein
MDDGGEGMVAFLGVQGDRRLLDADLEDLPETGPRPLPARSSGRHDRLVAVGSVMTAGTLIAGVAATLYGGAELVFASGGTLQALAVVIGLLLVATHWGWVHVAEYVGLTIDQRQRREGEEREQAWLATVAPYPRFGVRTRVLTDASTRIERILYQPVLTEHHTFTFAREVAAQRTYGADAAAADIAATAESMRRQARLETDRQRALWEAAATAYGAALHSADDDQQRLAAQHAAASALSEHLNASLLEPPLTE